MRNFAEVLARRASDWPDRKAFVFLGSRGEEAETLSFGELRSRAHAVAHEIAGRGLAGRNLLLLLPPGLDFVAALFGCFEAGAVAVPIPFTAGRRTADRVAAICRDAAPAGVLTISRHRAGRELVAAAGLAERLAWIDIDTIAGRGVTPLETPAPDAVALLQYTSGSISAPKGVMLTHANLIANNAMIAQAFGHDESLRGVGWLPLFHDMGLVGHVLQPVFVGGLSVLMSPLAFLQRPRRWLEAISAWQATTSGGPSHGYALCARQLREGTIDGLDLSSWKVAYCGSEPIQGDVLEAFADACEPRGFRASAFVPCYGLAEATLLVTSRGAGEGLRYSQPIALPGHYAGARRSVSCGRAWAGGSVSIRDAEAGAALADGEIGEICVSGDHVAAGYRNPAADARSAFVEARAGRRLLRTGDLGFLSGGELFVVGRLKDTIIMLGLKHAAEDIEAALASSSPLFDGQGRAVFVAGAETGDRAIAVQEVPARTDRVALAEAAAAARAAVLHAHGLRLDDIVLVRAGSLPRTSSGKVQRARARDIYAGGGFARLNEKLLRS